MQELVVNTSGRVGCKAEYEARAEECRKERKEEVEAELRGVAEDVVGEESLPGSPDNDAKWSAVQVP